MKQAAVTTRAPGLACELVGHSFAHLTMLSMIVRRLMYIGCGTTRRQPRHTDLSILCLKCQSVVMYKIQCVCTICVRT